VILLDVQMGDRNGLDAVRPIKSLTPSTRVLMFTSCFNPEWRARALSEGASDYLLKTDTLSKVAARIRCPATDANPLTQLRRRAKCPAAKSVVHQAVRANDAKSSGFFRRPLGMLRAWWN
jgi:DNA-binding NarL/FixJ family response regulator